MLKAVNKKEIIEEYKQKCNDLESKLEQQYKYNDELLSRIHCENERIDMKPDFNSEVLSRLNRIEEHLIRNDKLKKQKELKAKLDDTLYEMLGDSYDNGYYEGHR